MAESDAPGEPSFDPPPFSVEAQGLTLNFYPGGRERFDALLGLIASADTCLRLGGGPGQQFGGFAQGDNLSDRTIPVGITERFLSWCGRKSA